MDPAHRKPTPEEYRAAAWLVRSVLAGMFGVEPHHLRLYCRIDQGNMVPIPCPVTPPEEDATAQPRPSVAGVRGCREDTLRVLREAHPRRLTGPQVLDAYGRLGAEWSPRTMARTLKDLIAEGLVVNGGGGYLAVLPPG